MKKIALALSGLGLLGMVASATPAAAQKSVPGCAVGGSCYQQCLTARSYPSVQACMNDWGPRNVRSRDARAQMPRGQRPYRSYYRRY